MATIRVKNTKHSILTFRSGGLDVQLAKGKARDIILDDENVKLVESGDLEIIDSYGLDADKVATELGIKAEASEKQPAEDEEVQGETKRPRGRPKAPPVELPAVPIVTEAVTETAPITATEVDPLAPITPETEE